MEVREDVTETGDGVGVGEGATETVIVHSEVRDWGLRTGNVCSVVCGVYGCRGREGVTAMEKVCSEVRECVTEMVKVFLDVKEGVRDGVVKDWG